MKYRIQVREVWIQGIEVEASNLQEAIEKIKDGDGDIDENDFEYSHTLDPDTWTQPDTWRKLEGR